MEPTYTKSFKYKLLLIQFFLPNPIELIPYFVISLLVLLVMSNKTLLTILSGSSPVTPISVADVFGERMDSISIILATPILGRVVLFAFWLGVGSIAYMLVWLFQNIAIEVYEDVSLSKVKGQRRDKAADGWWGSSLSRAIFIFSGALVMIFYIFAMINILLPAWSKLFQMGLQDFSHFYGILQIMIAIIGTFTTLHILILFWKVYTRVKKIFYIVEE